MKNRKRKEREDGCVCIQESKVYMSTLLSKIRGDAVLFSNHNGVGLYWCLCTRRSKTQSSREEAAAGLIVAENMHGISVRRAPTSVTTPQDEEFLQEAPNPPTSTCPYPSPLGPQSRTTSSSSSSQLLLLFSRLMLSIRAEGGGCEGVTSVRDVCDNGCLLDGSVCV